MKMFVAFVSLTSSKKFDLLEERLKICRILWSANISAETSYKKKSEPMAQAGYASEWGISFIVWVGEEEAEAGNAKVKNMDTHEEVIMPVSELPDFIRSLR